jgi:hypothetical protein
LLALAPGAPGAAEVTVRVSGGRVDLTATAAPLGEVLDRLARQTGMKVVYEGPAPRHPVTLSIQGRTPAEAVLSVLEGSGVNFALVGDATGAGVQSLFVTGAAPASAPSAAPASRPSPGPRRAFGIPPASSPDTDDAAFPDEDTEAAEELGPGLEMTDPAAAAAPGSVVPPLDAARAPGDPAGAPLPPALPGFSASPFTPQPQPFPPGVRLPAQGTASPAAKPSPEENPASAAPPPS